MMMNSKDIAWKESGKLKLLIIVGTRPEIIRLAPTITKCRKYFDTLLAHTGQNWDYNLNDVFLRICVWRLRTYIWMQWERIWERLWGKSLPPLIS